VLPLKCLHNDVVLHAHVVQVLACCVHFELGLEATRCDFVVAMSLKLTALLVEGQLRPVELGGEEVELALSEVHVAIVALVFFVVDVACDVVDLAPPLVDGGV